MSGSRLYSVPVAIGARLLSGTSALVMLASVEPALSQTVLPQITVQQPKPAVKPTPRRTTARPQRAPAPAAPAPAAPVQTPEQVQQTANRGVVQRTTTLDQRRDDVLLPKVGANRDTKDQTDIESIPQGTNAQLSDLLAQFPGVSVDSTSQGDFHVRNEHANVQFRINGIVLPDGVSGFSQILETGLFKSISLIDGALPARKILQQAISP